MNLKSLSFLLTICMLAPESTTNSLSSGFVVDAAGKLHSSVGEKKCSFVLFSELTENVGKSPRISAGASLLSFQSPPENCPQISQRRDCADEKV